MAHSDPKYSPHDKRLQNVGNARHLEHISRARFSRNRFLQNAQSLSQLAAVGLALFFSQYALSCLDELAELQNDFRGRTERLFIRNGKWPDDLTPVTLEDPIPLDATLVIVYFFRDGDWNEIQLGWKECSEDKDSSEIGAGYIKPMILRNPEEKGITDTPTNVFYARFSDWHHEDMHLLRDGQKAPEGANIFTVYRYVKRQIVRKQMAWSYQNAAEMGIELHFYIGTPGLVVPRGM